MKSGVWMRGAVGVSLLALLGACASGDKAKPVVQPLVKAEGKRSVTVTAEQSGATIELGLDQTLVVRLATGSTGKQEWSLVGLAPGVLNPVGPTFERELPSNTDNVASGSSIWRLQPTAAGKVDLRFEYRRPRSVEPATDVVTYVVKVQ